MQSLLVLGSTGSIGTQTLDVVRASGGALKVSGLAAARSHAKLLEQVAEFSPRWVALADESAAAGLEQALPRGTQLCTGPDALARIARECEYDTAVHGIVGAAGLVPSLEVIRRGKKLALANKESLVMAGALLMPLARQCGAQIVPVDSEHSAIHQCLRGERVQDARRVILTASGGPFRRHTRAQMQSATCADALKHPTWTMGRRITIGSATLMNKALEVIELAHLFALDPGRIDVVIHPQSIVHSLVEFVDGSVLAQLGLPDMRVPIHYAIHWPQRAPNSLSGFDLAKFARLEFEAPDRERFPALAMGYRALELGGCAGAVLNAADEVAVEAFLEGRIGFMDMATVQSAALEAVRLPADAMETVLRADQLAREHARASIARLGNTP